MKSALWMVAAVVLPTAACGPKRSPGPPTGVNLSGSWVLDRRDSQDRPGTPGGEGERRRGVGRGGRGGFPGGGGFRRGGDRGPRMGGPQVDPEKIRQTMDEIRSLMQASETLALRQTASDVTVTYADSFTVTVPTDGKKVERTWPGVGKVELKAEWKEGQLQLERKLEGIKVTELFSRSPGSSRLVDAVKVKGPMPREISLERIYDERSESSKPEKS